MPDYKRRCYNCAHSRLNQYADPGKVFCGLLDMPHGRQPSAPYSPHDEWMTVRTCYAYEHVCDEHQFTDEGHSQQYIETKELLAKLNGEQVHWRWP